MIAALLVFQSVLVAHAASRADGGSPGPQPVPVPFMAKGEVIMFGSTDGITVGGCNALDSGGGPAYFAAIFESGKVVTRGMPTPYPGPHLASTDVRHLVRIAQQLHFRQIQPYIRDVNCPGFATTYLRIRFGRLDHTVEAYGYSTGDPAHPRFDRLMRILWNAALGYPWP